MSVTAVGDGSLKLRKRPKKSKSVASHTNPGNADEVRAKPKRKMHQEATKNVLSLDHKEEDQVRSGDIVHDQSKDVSKDDESRKEKKKKKRSDEGKEEGAAKSDNAKVQMMEEAAPDKSQQKKRKSSAEEQSEDTPAADKSRKKRKRRHATETLFPDPSADESLSDQSQKALSYAYSRFQHLPHWKFNKVTQIWLVKQLWSEEMIPEKYFPLVVKYLAAGEGRIRETLVQMCNSAIVSVTADASVASATGLTDLSNGESATTTEVTRARSLLDALSRVQ
ncbi:hypothetical protein AZE42_04885 [Rhizopogon vesiculosus]|uniref:WKF domain-containing protein n=1 Tax=Rhizopogon vesiculosus TaxID=180088 RepID=A0A1J8QDT9_9AGAM|nr:hypothetical protein AZE42_04885 [Rhizopogon vesiculosus]